MVEKVSIILKKELQNVWRIKKKGFSLQPLWKNNGASVQRSTEKRKITYRKTYWGIAFGMYIDINLAILFAYFANITWIKKGNKKKQKKIWKSLERKEKYLHLHPLWKTTKRQKQEFIEEMIKEQVKHRKN